MFKFQNGEKAKDTVTGFEGTITARAEYLTGCRQYSITAKTGKDGDVKIIWFDEDRLVLTSKKKHEIKKQNSGGPMAHSTKG